MFKECFCGVSKGDMNVYDVQLPCRADHSLCCQAPVDAQVVVDMNLDLTFVGYGQPLDPCGAELVSCPSEDGGEPGVGHLGCEGLFLPQYGVWVTSRHDRYILQVRSFGCFVQDAWFVERHEGDERLNDFVVCALVVPAGPLAGRNSSHCPRRSSRLIAVAPRGYLVPPAIPVARHLSRRCLSALCWWACGAVPGTLETACRPRVRSSVFLLSRPTPGALAMRSSAAGLHVGLAWPVYSLSCPGTIQTDLVVL